MNSTGLINPDVLWVVVIGLVSGVLGIVTGAQTIFGWLDVERMRVRFNLPLKDGDVQLFITRSKDDKGNYNAVRPLTGIGQVVALEHALILLGRHFPQKTASVVLSPKADDRSKATFPRGDAVVLGGPARNAYAALLAERIQKWSNPVVRFEGDVLAGVETKIAISERTFEYRPESDVDDQSMPTRDTGFVVVLRNPIQQEAWLVWCFGQTSYGTAAAARWYFRERLGRLDFRKIALRRTLLPNYQGFIAALELKREGEGFLAERTPAVLWRLTDKGLHSPHLDVAPLPPTTSRPEPDQQTL